MQKVLKFNVEREIRNRSVLQTTQKSLKKKVRDAIAIKTARVDVLKKAIEDEEKIFTTQLETLYNEHCDVIKAQREQLSGARTWKEATQRRITRLGMYIND